MAATQRSVPRSALFLEELIGDFTRCTLLSAGSVQPGDLVLQRFDPLRQFLNRQQREILSDLVDDFFLDRQVLIHCRNPYRGEPRLSHRQPASTRMLSLI